MTIYVYIHNIAQIDQLKIENEKLHSENENVQSKIGEQYTSFTIKINSLNQKINGLDLELAENNKEKELFENEIDEQKLEINNYQSQIGRYKEIARKAEANLDRIESLEEELRDKIRDNHQLQIKTRSLNQTIQKITEKCDRQNLKIKQLETSSSEKLIENEKLKNDNITYKQDNKMLNEKINILIKENANHTLQNEKHIENIESYHLSKYKTLLKSFQIMKQRVDVNNNRFNNIKQNKNKHKPSYSNQGWKKYHEDHNYSNFNLNETESKQQHLTYSIDLEMDQDEVNEFNHNINQNINELLTPSSSIDGDNNSSKQLKKYQSQIKEYKSIIHSLQKQLKDSKDTIQIQQKTNKKFLQQNKRLNKPKNINIDYLRNVLVKFLILSEYLTDEQVVLVPVLGSILNLTKTERDMIDDSYNSNRYFLGTV